MSPDNKHYLRCLETLKDSVIFKNLEKRDIQSVLNYMTRIKWEKGVFKNSTEFNSSLHFIISGRIKGYQINPNTGREHTMFILTKHDVFDILNLMDTETHVLYWETLDDLEILTISIAEMRRMLAENPKLNFSTLKYLGSRVRILEDASNDICLHNTLSRLSSLLLKYFNQQSHKLETINNLPNSEIANLIGTTRAVVNRHIQELKKAGAISVKRKEIDIENVETLIAFAHDN